MSNPAVGAKYVAALVVGVVGAGAFAGVSHDGRGAAAPADPDPVVEAPPSTSAVHDSTVDDRAGAAIRATAPPARRAVDAQPASRQRQIRSRRGLGCAAVAAESRGGAGQ